jgi:hydroxymethylpyrimidine/phosphomethylpyrimidine kinase
MATLIYDNGGETLDRYTAVFTHRPERQPGIYEALGFNSEPYHGIGMHVSSAIGPHLGKRISLKSLPDNAKRFVEQNK